MFQRVPVSPPIRAWLLHLHNIREPRSEPIVCHDGNDIGLLLRHMLYSMPSQPATSDPDHDEDLTADVLVDVPEAWVCEMFPPSRQQYAALNAYLYKNMVAMLQHSIVTLHTYGIFGQDADMITMFIDTLGIDDRDDRLFYALQKAIQRLSVRQGRAMKRSRGVIIQPTTI